MAAAKEYEKQQVSQRSPESQSDVSKGCHTPGNAAPD